MARNSYEESRLTNIKLVQILRKKVNQEETEKEVNCIFNVAERNMHRTFDC